MPQNLTERQMFRNLFSKLGWPAIVVLSIVSNANASCGEGAAGKFATNICFDQNKDCTIFRITALNICFVQKKDCKIFRIALLKDYQMKSRARWSVALGIVSYEFEMQEDENGCHVISNTLKTLK
jgi:hypothetical protein